MNKYFPHDCNARTDERIIALRIKYGWSGYGLYFALIEKLCDSMCYSLKADYNLLAYDLRSDASLVKSVICDFGLFAFTEDGECFYSESLNRRMEPLDAKIKRAKNAAETRWGSKSSKKTSKKLGKNANAMQMHKEVDANALQMHASNDAEKIREDKIRQDNKNTPSPPKGDGQSDEKIIFDEKQKTLHDLDNEIKKRAAELDALKEPPPKKLPNPLNSEARKIFEDHFRDTFLSEYYWTAKDAGSMSSMLKKLKYLREQKKMTTDDSDIINALKYMLESITEGWIFENFSVSNINSKFNEIVSQAKSRKNGKAGSNTGIVKSGTDRYATGRVNAEDRRASLEHLGQLADAILQSPTT